MTDPAGLRPCGIMQMRLANIFLTTCVDITLTIGFVQLSPLQDRDSVVDPRYHPSHDLHRMNRAGWRYHVDSHDLFRANTGPNQSHIGNN